MSREDRVIIVIEKPESFEMSKEDRDHNETIKSYYDDPPNTESNLCESVDQ